MGPVFHRGARTSQHPIAIDTKSQTIHDSSMPKQPRTARRVWRGVYSVERCAGKSSQNGSPKPKGQNRVAVPATSADDSAEDPAEDSANAGSSAVLTMKAAVRPAPRGRRLGANIDKSARNRDKISTKSRQNQHEIARRLAFSLSALTRKHALGVHTDRAGVAQTSRNGGEPRVKK